MFTGMSFPICWRKPWVRVDKQAMLRRPSASLLSLVAALVIATSGVVWGQIPAPKLWGLFPPGAARGGELVVEVVGKDLGSANQLYFSHSGIEATPSTNEAGEILPGAFQVSVSDKVVPGVYEAWVGGSLGLSNSRLFVISDLDEVKDDAPSHSIDDAVVVPVGVVVNGRTAANQKNYYRIFLRQDQAISLSCYGSEIDSKLEPAIELYDEFGKLLARERRGNPLRHSAESTGPVFVAVSDLTYRGGNDFFYRLSIHSQPLVSMNLPFSGNPDSLETAYLFGFHLGTGSWSNDRLNGEVRRISPNQTRSSESLSHSVNRGSIHSLAALCLDLPLWGLREYGVDGIGLPSFRKTEQNGIVDFSENATATQSLKIELPARVSGVFGTAHSSGVYEFEATEGETWWFEVLSSRQGMATHPYILVEHLNSDQKSAVRKIAEWSRPTQNLDRREFPLRSRDPQGELTIKKTGRYRVTVADLFGGQGRSVNKGYELSIRKPDPGVRGVFRFQPTLHQNVNRSVAVESSTVSPGQVLPVKVLLERLDAYQGRVGITTVKPVQGIDVRETIIAEGEKEGVLLLEVSPDAGFKAASVELMATCLDTKKPKSVPLTFGQIVWDVGDYNNESAVSRLSTQCLLSTIDGGSAPVRLVPGQDGKRVWETALGGEVTIPLECFRVDGFDADYSFKLAGNEAVSKHPGVSFAKGVTKSDLVIKLSETKLSAGLHGLYLYGEVKGNYQRPGGNEKKEVSLSVFSPAIDLRVFSAPFELISAEAGLVLRPGNETTVSIELRRRFGFAGQVEVSTVLKGQPTGVKSRSSMLQDGRFNLSLSASEISEPTQFNVILKAKGVYHGREVASDLLLPIQLETLAE